MQIFGDQIRFGVSTGQQHTTYESCLDVWHRAEELGYDWANVFDHFLPIYSDPEGPCFEGMSLLSALAAKTSTLRCGVLVVGNTYRNPAVLANIATTIDHVSNGRLELGIGAGWFQMEHDQYGIPFHTTGRRIRMLGESVEIMKSLWTQHRTTFEGRYYQLEDALCEPKPVQQPHIPLWIGGTGEQLTLRIVAESADGWNTFFMPMEIYQRKLAALTEHCRAVGRDPGDIRKSLLTLQSVVRESESDVQEIVERMPQQQASTSAGIRPPGLFGTPEQCVEQLLPYAQAGVGDFVFAVHSPADYQSMELIATKVAPMLRERAAEAK
jgi:F420-dependent oxidoreductase-like protein